MFNKKFIIPLLIIALFIVVGLSRVNIINTKALSPMGNTEDNYALVSAEFGEDFTEFIKDDAEVKIYTGEGEEDASIRIKEKEFKLQKDNPFIKVFVSTGEKIKNSFLSVKGKIDNKIKDINKNNVEKEKINEELDSTVDDFIKSREENKNSIENSINEETNLEDNLETSIPDESNDDTLNSEGNSNVNEENYESNTNID
ncbi:MAG: hypothetical protein RSC24_12420 [Clostridium sp.]